TAAEQVRETWAELIECACDWQNVDQIGAVLGAYERNPILRRKLARLVEPVVLDSPEAERMRETYRKTLEVEQRRRPTRPSPAPEERTVGLLDSLEAGDLTAWWRLNAA